MSGEGSGKNINRWFELDRRAEQNERCKHNVHIFHEFGFFMV